ncbi:hypothetical protein [Pedobacter jeongneungensis]|uniref:hypothetical protein n=1 Tax=Pedobacter jeongneungensis TaxID=947309 RepID=UPI00046A0C8A|nr:hypothetical protein [Pedobacter jeongneungensis]
MKKIKFLIFAFLFFSVYIAKAQTQKIKKDTVYYLLDTLSVPAKDRMFKVEREGPAMVYQLQCKCYPYSTSITFYYDINRKKEKIIKISEAKKIKTVSITELISLAVKSLLKEEANEYKFVFLEPSGNDINLINMVLAPPYNPNKVQ